MSQLTINTSIALMDILKARISELRSLRDKVAVTESRAYFGEPKSETTTTPQYDVKFVDKKITQLQNTLFKLNGAIKEANAKTPVNINLDVDELLAPLQ